MFEALTDRLQGIVRNLTGQGRLTPDNIRDSLREVRRALLEADVQLAVARDFVARVEQRAVGDEVLNSLTPGQQVVKVVRDELESLLGRTPVTLAGSPHLPTTVLLAGLQGSGKTTFAGKLALWLKARGKRVLLASGDVYRPAAIDQLERVAAQAGSAFWRAPEGGFDFLLFDTAGRLHVDEPLMDELKALKHELRAHQVLLVVDGMTGQEAVRIGQTFATEVGVDGLVLTKMDGDARGGAALSLRAATGKPIVFLGVGEKLDGLEAFDPGRLAGRILGMGDVLGLVERAQAAVDQGDAIKLAERMRRTEFTLEDFLEQLKQVRKMGPLGDLMKMIPGMPRAMQGQAPDEKRLGRHEAILLSMTRKERRLPRLIDGSRRRRIAAGSGTSVTEVNQLLKDFDQARTLMKRLRSGGLPGLGRRRGGMR